MRMRVVLLVLSFVFAFSSVSVALAHPGGLNSSGCHNDRKRGGYHCHRSTYTPPAPRAAPKPKPKPKAPARKAASKSTPAKRSAKARNDFRRANPCPVTGRTTGSCPGWEVDHVVPLACGGPDTPSNMQWLTAKENRKKGAMGCKRRANAPAAVIVPSSSTNTSAPSTEPTIETDEIAPNPDSPLAVMMAWRDRMCRCPDLACGVDVGRRIAAWRKAEAPEKTTAAMSATDLKLAEQLEAKTGECMARLERNANGDQLTRGMISEGIAKVRNRVVDCGADSKAKGRVKVKVAVDHNGEVTSVELEATPDKQLGECVANVVRTATFAKTNFGGAFSYPFVF